MKSPISLMKRLSALIQTGPGAHPASCIIGTRLFPGVKWPGYGVNHPPLSSTKAKEGISYTSIRPLCLHGTGWTLPFYLAENCVLSTKMNQLMVFEEVIFGYC